MTQQEKDCYNTYLSSSRIAKNKPFKYRQNFEDFEKDNPSEYLYIKRLCNFFNKYPHVRHAEYFKAPYEIYNKEDYFDLKFFASQKAIKTYSIYMKQKKDQSPDNPEMLDFIKDSLRNIGSYCIHNNIQLDQYITHKEGYNYCWLKHLKEYKTCIYPLFYWAEFTDLITNLPADEKDLFLGDMAKHIFTYKTRLNTSTQAKHMIMEGVKRIKKITDNSTNSIDK